MPNDIKKGDWLTPRIEQPQPDLDIDIVMPKKGKYYEVVSCSEYSYVVRNPLPDKPHACTWIDIDNAIKYEPKFLVGETLICTNLDHPDKDGFEEWTEEAGLEVGERFVVAHCSDLNVKIEGCPYLFSENYFKPVYPDKSTQQKEIPASISASPKPIIQPTKEDSAMPNTTSILTEVSTAPYATKKVNTFYGSDVSTMQESDLYDVLTRIKEEKEALVSLETGEASKRILAKIESLNKARAKAVAFIDVLDDK